MGGERGITNDGKWAWGASGSSHWDPPHFHPLLEHDGDADDDDHDGDDEMLIMILRQ